VLDIGYSYYGEVLPPSVFRLAPVLRVPSFSRCRLPANLAVDFPSLEKLGLYNMFLTEEALCALLSGCPALRSLQTNVSSKRLRISAPALRSISFCNSTQLVIEDAPFLERVLLLNDGYTIPPRETTVRVVHAPKLKILGSFGRVITQLHLGKTVSQVVSVNNSEVRLHAPIAICSLAYYSSHAFAKLLFLVEKERC
jgi:hypothetical protein